jgi:hypothetical protein
MLISGDYAQAQTRVEEKTIEKYRSFVDDKTTFNDLNNSQILQLLNLFTHARNLPRGVEKQEIAKEIHLITGVDYFYIGDDIYGFTEEAYLSEEKRDCMVEIKKTVNPDKNTISTSRITKNCRGYIPEMVQIFGYKTIK